MLYNYILNIVLYGRKIHITKTVPKLSL